MISGRMIFLMVLVLISGPVSSQVTSAKITFERRTNLSKKFKGRADNWIKKDQRAKTDTFELFFEDSVSLFRPKESDLKEKMGWATQKNIVYQDFRNETRFSIKEIWGEKLYYTDSLFRRTWKITDHYRKIAGYNCRKAIWQADDSTRIYAWYAEELMASTGPESFYGLPGAILGLATEDGGVVYFARSVEPGKHDVSYTPPSSAKKIYTAPGLRAKLEDEIGKEEWGKDIIRDFFEIW